MNPDIMNNQMASLYVGNLPTDVTEVMLFEKFSTAGPLLSIRVCRGYAYVNFQHPTDAKRALDTMNFDLIKGREMRIMWSKRDSSLRKSSVGNVFIKNLHHGIDSKSLYNVFSGFGKILSCKITQDESGASKGFGYVHFETQEAANKSIEKVNGMVVAGKKLHVGHFIPRKESEKELVKKADAAETAVEALNGRLASVCNEYLDPKFQIITDGKDLAEGKLELSNRSQIANLYIKNLDDTIHDELLLKAFLPFGTITSAKVMMEKGRSKGFGFVCFSTPEEATKAMTEMNGRIVGSKPLYVALAQQKEDRKAHLESQYMQKMANMQMLQMGQFIQPETSSGNFIPTIPAPQLYGAELSNRSQGVNLYIKNLDDTIHDELLLKAFLPFGTITSAKVMIEKGRSKGFGFVCFSTPEEATKAMTEMNGRIVWSKPLYVALAQQKKDRKAHLESQMPQMGQFIQPGTSSENFIPTIPDAPQRFYGAAQIRTNPPGRSRQRRSLRQDTNNLQARATSSKSGLGHEEQL